MTHLQCFFLYQRNYFINRFNGVRPNCLFYTELHYSPAAKMHIVSSLDLR